MTSTINAIDAADIRELREEIVWQGGSTAGVSEPMMLEILARTGDVDLAATAIVMSPRPAWVAAIVPGSKGMRP